ncbi:MAG: ribonuclease Z, partial [FCB group bacterium]|nr:ribonuclease Z [FCB group bacterium]
VLGYRFTKRSRLRFRQELLDAHELYGPLVGQLETDGSIMHKGELISREELSYRTKEKIFAYVLDTGICNAIPELIRDADAVLMEGTYLNTEQELADRYGHMTAEAAARYARDHHVGKLILTHYSERYKDLNLYEKAVEKLFKNTHIAKDFDVIAI